MKLLIRIILLLAPAASLFAQQSSVVNSKHNLSASGPGQVRATSENEVCIFCHAPHNSTPVRPLWNRLMPQDAYSIYSSRSLNARPGQPTGMSKMCLSCHDGTIALGTVVSRNQPIMMSGGVTTMPAGASNIGTDLRDDHPISFRFDASLAAHNPKLKSPSALPPEIKLDSNSELQCTSCHDAHNNSLGKFMVMRNDNSEMCKSCHQMGQTAVTGHTNCNACHQPHTAPSGPYLLRRQTITETCTSCHDGSVSAAANISTSLHKASVHDTQSPVDPPAPASANVTCTSCHDPHTMGHGGTTGLNIPANFGAIDGMSDSGSPIAAAILTHQVCFKCHADGNTLAVTVTRMLASNNLRLKFSPSSVSSHPVMAAGRNPLVPSLKPGWTTASRMTCEDCHNSDTSRAAGGSDANGVHGSNNRPLLVARYDTADYTTESAQAYALCYKCHDRTSILGDRSFNAHKKHIVEQRAPCASCHDAHGIPAGQGSVTNNSNLINFATSMVQSDRRSGRLEFNDTGQYRGQCYLSCHGESHSPRRYP
jgi:predicted CXXCH cytochrome family protein